MCALFMLSPKLFHRPPSRVFQSALTSTSSPDCRASLMCFAPSSTSTVCICKFLRSLQVGTKQQRANKKATRRRLNGFENHTSVFSGTSGFSSSSIGGFCEGFVFGAARRTNISIMPRLFSRDRFLPKPSAAAEAFSSFPVDFRLHNNSGLEHCPEDPPPAHHLLRQVH